MKTIVAYTDGSAVIVGPRKGQGGFGTYFPDLFGVKKGYSKGYENTKTGRMEVTALYYAIKAMPLKSEEKIILRVYSDSQYVVKTFTENRLQKWIANNWISYGSEIKNVDLWKAIIEERGKRDYLILNMVHIKSHQVEKEKNEELKKSLMQDPNIIGNMMADRLADYKRHKQLNKSDKL
jgi:ribonuclease HI